MTEKDNLFGEKETESTTWSKWSAKISQNLTLKLYNGKTIAIDQNSKGFGELGSRVWDGALVLSRYVEHLGSNYFAGKRSLELGSGTGLVGIVAGALGANITLTDKQSLLALLQHNVDKNIENSSSHVQVKELFWGTGNPFGQPFDIVLGADLTYEFEDLPILISTLVDVTTKGSVVYIAFGKERAATPTFLELAAKHFEVSFVKDEELNNSDIEIPSFEIGIAIMKRV